MAYVTIDGEQLETTPEHRFYTHERGWVAADELWSGAHVYRANGSLGVVQGVATVQRWQPMYDLVVAQARTFFVGSGQWLVHNCDSAVPYFRVQGGRGQSTSQQRVQIDANGNVSIRRGHLNVSRGSLAHARYFQTKRPGSQIYQFYVPKWLDELIVNSAIPQTLYRSNPLNQGKLAPKIVDPSTPGQSYELPPVWSQWLSENVVPGSGQIIP